MLGLSALTVAIQSGGAPVCGSCWALQVAISSRIGIKSSPFFGEGIDFFAFVGGATAF